MNKLQNNNFIKQTKLNLLQFTLFNKKLFIRRPLLTLKDLIQPQILCGIKINLNGRLKGAKRARNIQLMKGKIKAQTFSFPIQANYKSVQTK